jgi:hypothetical protein
MKKKIWLLTIAAALVLAFALSFTGCAVKDWLTGPQGEQGLPGEQGSQGPQGEQSPQGDYSVRFMYRDAKTGKEKIVERFCGESGNVAPPLDAGDVAQTADNPALQFTGWNFSGADFANIQGGLDIGAVYETQDGASWFKIDIADESSLTQVLNFTQDDSSTVTVDWGDGSSDTVSSATGGVLLKHTYSSAGSYWIRLGVSDGKCYLGAQPHRDGYNVTTRLAQLDKTSVNSSPSNSAYYAGVLVDDTQLDNLEAGMQICFASGISGNIMGSAAIVAVNADTGVITFSDMCTLTANPYIYVSAGFLGGGKPSNRDILRGAFIGGDTAVQSYCFAGQRELNGVTLPDSGDIAIGDFVFSGCHSLKSMVMPLGIDDTVGMGNFVNCYALNFVSIPKTVKRLGPENFYNCGMLGRVVYHAGLDVFAVS